MKFKKITLEALLQEIAILPSDWKDEVAGNLLREIEKIVSDLRQLKSTPTLKDFEKMLAQNPSFLDVSRLFLGLGQEPASHLICEKLGKATLNWPSLKSFSIKNPKILAKALCKVGLPELVVEHLSRDWRAEDILIERYKMTRGRAIAGQKRGRALEDEVQAVINKIKIPFERGVTFIGHKGEKAKCDFAIPLKDHPKIVMEAKGFEATGSKLTDFLGDILKIGQAKEYHTYFFLITDGRGWHNRQSDLKKIIQYHHDGLIDMVYTRARLKQLAEDVNSIVKNE